MRLLKLDYFPHYFAGKKEPLNIHQKIISAFVLFNLVVFMYEELFHFIVGIFHGLFESTEHLLDISIEYLFETHTHETQVIVFYILVACILYSLYWIYRFIPRCYAGLKKGFAEQKQQTIAQWQALPLLQKLEWWGFFVSFFSCWLFFSF
jgi:hypothetical protein